MKRALTAGVLGGLGAGLVMVMWSMVVLAVVGEGFWAPLNYIAHTFWNDVPLGGAFSWGGLLVGMSVHLMMSMLLGAVFGVLLGWRRGVSLVGVVFAGVAYGIGIWLINHVLLWPLIDEAAAKAFVLWVFLVGHVLYGLVLALALMQGRGARAPRAA